MNDLEAIEARISRLTAWGVTTGKDLTMAELLTVDTPALIAEVRKLRCELAEARAEANEWCERYENAPLGCSECSY